jgi:hypothetical protein
MTTRQKIHAEIDKMLDEWGVGQTIEQSWGSIIFQFVFERGKVVLTGKERITNKEIK